MTWSSSLPLLLGGDNHFGNRHMVKEAKITPEEGIVNLLHRQELPFVSGNCLKREERRKN